MTCKLEYNLSGEEQFEDEPKLRLALDSQKMSFLIWEMNQVFRNELKYNEELTEDQFKIVEKLQESFTEKIEEYSLGYVLD